MSPKKAYTLIDKISDAATKHADLSRSKAEIKEKFTKKMTEEVSQKIFASNFVKNIEMNFQEFQSGYNLARNKSITNDSKYILFKKAQKEGNNSFVKGFKEGGLVKE